MKRLYTLLYALAMTAICVSASGQDSFRSYRSYNPEDFNEIIAEGNFKIDIVLSEKNKIDVFCMNEKDLEMIDVTVKDGSLLLSSKASGKGIFRKKHYPEARAIIYVRNLESVDLSGECTLKSDENLASNNFYLKTSGAAEIERMRISGTRLKVISSGASEIKADANFIDCNMEFSGAAEGNLDIEAQIIEMNASGASELDCRITGNTNLTIKGSGAADITIKGSGEHTSFVFSGSSELDAEEFTGKTSEVQTSGSSSATVHVTETLDAKASGASSVRYIGKPHELRTSTSGAGSVKEKN